MDIGYWWRLGGTLARGLRRPRRLAALIQHPPPFAGAAPVFEMRDLFPGLTQVEVDMGVTRFDVSNQDPSEQFLLGAVCQLRRPRRIFEIGTFDGTATLQMARNAPNAEIFTLDLAPEEAGVASFAPEAGHAASGLVGSRLRDQPESARIRQLFGDSRRFDFSPWYGQIDLVVIDGGHSYDCVSSDTQNALRMLSPGGVIVWDDYAPAVWPDVVRTVDQTGLNIAHVYDTGFAVYDSAREAAGNDEGE
jgi:predicted O-methyltransferase YrrM